MDLGVLGQAAQDLGGPPEAHLMVKTTGHRPDLPGREPPPPTPLGEGPSEPYVDGPSDDPGFDASGSNPSHLLSFPSGTVGRIFANANFVKLKNSQMQSFVDRLWEIIKQRFGGKWTLLAKAAGISPGSFKRYLNQETKPSFDHLVRICEVSGVNPTWLLTGEGPMFVQEGEPERGLFPFLIGRLEPLHPFPLTASSNFVSIPYR